MKAPTLRIFALKGVVFCFFVFNSFSLFAQNSLRLTATPQGLSCGDIDVTGTQLTLEAKVFSVATSVNVISKHTGPANCNYLLRMGSIELNTSNGFTTLASPIPVSNNQCYHIAATYDGATIRYYVNGCETAAAAWSGTLTQNNLATGIGLQTAGLNEQFFGYIDEVRIWNVVRTQAQIEANMDVLPTPGAQAGLLAYYDFNAGITNVQGNAAFNGSLIGGATMAVNPSCPLTTQLFSITVAGTDVACGVGGGTISVATTGGIAPYQYSLDGVTFQANPTFTNVAAGIYTVTATSANGCIRTANVTINDPGPIVIVPNQTDVFCQGQSTGSISIGVTGGTPLYTAAWTPNTYTGATLTNIPAGNYSVVVTDALGCTQTQAFTITQPTGMSVTVTGVQDISCFNANDGQATMNPVGGAPPYSYVWDNGEITVTALGLSGGSHTGRVFDANNCFVVSSAFNISEPPALTGSVAVTQQVLCAGASNGEATITVNGGTPNYTITWPAGGNTTTVTNLSSGNGIVNIVDANGCTATANYSVTQPVQLGVTVATNNNVRCNGGSDGAATATATNGTAPYSFTWTNGFVGASPTNLPVGNSTVTATDANGCTATATVNLTAPTILATLINIDNQVGCAGGTNGQATASPTGGTAPYSYVWNNAETTQSAGNLSAGPMSVTVTDNNGCISLANGIMTEPAGMTVTVSAITDISCNGLTDGSATATITGGTPPFTYLWDNNESTQTATALGPGTNHYAGAVDLSGCTQLSNTFTIIEPAALAVSVTSQTNISCFGANDGQATVNVTGGISPYQYSWPSGQTTNPGTGLNPGVQPVTVTDANLCQTTFNVTIVQPLQLTVTASLVSNISCFGDDNGSALADVVGGTAPFTYSWTNGETTSPAVNLPPGNNIVTVTDANGCTAVAPSINIVEPVVLTGIVTIISDATCFGFSDGNASATPGGGTAPYTYLWDNAETTQVATQLNAGNHVANITDFNGCVFPATGTITEPLEIDFTVSGGGITICYGQSTPLDATPAAGQLPLTFNWDNAFTGASQNVTPLITTSYTVIASAGVCVSEPQTVTITVREPLVITAFGDTAVCVNSPITVNSIGSGGDGNLTYTWDNGLPVGAGPHTTSPVATTNYVVTLTDGCGSTPATDTVTVLVYPYPNINYTSNGTEGCQPFRLTLQNTTTIDSGLVIQYQWIVGDQSSNQVDPTPFILNTPGNYPFQLICVSDFGCADTLEVDSFVTVHPKPIAAFTPDPAVTDQFNSTILMANQTTGAITYEWPFRDSTYTEFSPGVNIPDTGINYITLIATSDFGCKDTAVQSVQINPMFAFYVPSAFSVNQDYVNEIFTPKGVGFNQYEMKIFNRWGEEIYRTKDIEKGWNGRLKGTEDLAKQDYYVYDIKLILFNDTPKYYKGKVCLLR